MTFDLPRLLADTFVRQVEYHEELPSTNDLALRLAAEENRELPLLVLAERQSAGRGRGVNRWWSRDGALTFTLVGDFVDARSPQRWPQISLVVALAVCEAIETFVPRHQVAVKWPNDVFLERKKTCGILIESPARPVGRNVIGIGVNVNNSFAEAPPELRSIATSLSDTVGTEFCLTTVLIEILHRLEMRLSDFRSGQADFHSAWRPRCLLTGRIVTLNDGQRDVTGLCRGLAEDGALLLQTNLRMETIYSGVVKVFD